MTEELNIEHFRKIAQERDWTLPTRMMLLKHLESYAKHYLSAVKGRQDFREALKQSREETEALRAELITEQRKNRVCPTVSISYDKAFEEDCLKLRAQNAIYRALLEDLVKKECGCEPVTLGGYTCPIHKALASSPDELLGAVREATLIMLKHNDGKFTNALTRFKKALGEE